MEASQISGTAGRTTVGRYAEISELTISHDEKPFEMEQTGLSDGGHSRYSYTLVSPLRTVLMDKMSQLLFLF